MQSITIRLDDNHIERLDQLQQAVGLDNRSDVMRALIQNSAVEFAPAPVARLKPAKAKRKTANGVR